MNFTLENVVYTVLSRSKESRKDDFILVLEVIREYCPPLIDMKIKDILMEHKELGLPSFESITRARRKVQKEYPELIDYDTKKRREQLKKEFKNYYMNEREDYE